MKKILSIALVLALVLSFGVTAFADTQTGNPANKEQTMPANQQNTIEITKYYKLTGDDTAKSPAETITFTAEKTDIENPGVKPGTQEPYTVETMPAIVSVTLPPYSEGAAVSTGNGSESKLSVVLPAYDAVGVYTYTITEADGNKAGVVYGANTNPIKLVVTVTQAPATETESNPGLLVIAGIHAEAADSSTKTDTFTNTYSAGKLSVSKTVTGNMGDKSLYFDFEVTFTAPTTGTAQDVVGAPVTITGATGPSDTENPTTIATTEWSSGSVTKTFKLKDGDTLTFENLPAGVEYTVTETAVTGYTTTKSGDSGTIAANATSTAAFTNDKTADIDTGISLDSLPYILIVAVVLGAAVVMFVNKRRSEV